MFRPEIILEKKATLFALVVVSTISILAVPVILPHIFHEYHISHIILHIAGIILAVFLLILSVVAYHRLKSKRLFLTAIAFSVFFTSEVVTLIESVWPYMYYIGDLALLEVGHLLIIATLGLLAMAVFRND